MAEQEPTTAATPGERSTTRGNKTPIHLGQVAAAVVVGALWAFAGSDGGDRVGGLAVFALAVIVAFVINWIVFVPSFSAQTEHYYDLTGSITYLTITLLTFTVADGRDARSLLLVALIMVWALRLGTFLFRRVRRDGKDGRFDKIKTNWAQFLMAWTVQGLWVSVTAGAALAAISSGDKQSIGVVAFIGLAIWAVGFGIEVMADRQKSAFRADPANDGRFITTGLWAWSRHPNYFGEITLWVGVAIIALPVLQGWQYVTLLSPVLVTALLTKGSGIPLLERRADKRWGGEADYEAYKANTPVLIPRPPTR
jgi:steroid 5-alpha reductase family enzyme